MTGAPVHLPRSSGRSEGAAQKTWPSAWAEILDAMDAGLESFPPVLVDYQSLDPGPLPLALRDRAVATLRRMAEAEAELEAQQAEVARELIGLSAARTAAASTTAPNVPRFLDTRA